ncbi:hypothetical protein HY256_08080 [Candidatus Sumerlaeota bacterium]|nr:hypothetical protein [Candidatus Sumerlaeota bacterium]
MKFPRRALLLLLLVQAGLFALGPAICRAVMTPAFAQRAKTCCSERGTDSERGQDAPAKSSESCPLHRLGAIKSLAPNMAASLSIPHSVAPIIPMFLISPAIAMPGTPCAALRAAPDIPPKIPLIHLLSTLRI